MNTEDIYRQLRTRLRAITEERGLPGAAVRVSAGTLSPQEAIGKTEHADYPLLTGRESMMQAVVQGSQGQAFTDMCGPWSGTLDDVVNLDLKNSHRRAVFVATLNAVMRLTGEVEDTRHCRDDGPVRCAAGLADFIRQNNLNPPYALFGLQPRLAESLGRMGDLSIVDLDPGNIGTTRCGVTIRPPEDTEAIIANSRTLFVTGTTLVNNTIGAFLNRPIPVIFFGVTIAGAASILDLRRFCPAAS